MIWEEELEYWTDQFPSLDPEEIQELLESLAPDLNKEKTSNVDD